MRLIGSFVAIAGACLVVQFVTMNSAMNDLGAMLSTSNESVGLYITELGIRNLAIATAVLIPVSLILGILMTFRIAGPLYRFKLHLQKIIDGEDPGPCKIRDSDSMQDLCLLINEAIDTARRSGKQRVEMGEVSCRVPENETPHEDSRRLVEAGGQSRQEVRLQ